MICLLEVDLFFVTDLYHDTVAAVNGRLSETQWYIDCATRVMIPCLSGKISDSQNIFLPVFDIARTSEAERGYNGSAIMHKH